METTLQVCVGQYSDKGRKDTNQDSHGAYLPKPPQLISKGVAIVLADGISSSDVSHIASEAAVKSFLADYFCTSDAWSTKKSAQQVLMATNSWLHSQTQRSPYRFDKDRGYVCTFSALVIKSNTAYIFHIGDARIYRRSGDALEQLTQEHRVWISSETSYLSRALGVNAHLEIDAISLTVEQGDVFILATDGVHEYVSAASMRQLIDQYADNLDQAAKAIVGEAYAQGSPDNLTVQIVRVDALPNQEVRELSQQLAELPFPPNLDSRMDFDGYHIVRELHASHRSHVYLAVEQGTQKTVVLKVPSVDMQHDAAHMERFLMEEWIGRRLNSAYVLKPYAPKHKRQYTYVVTEWIEGQTLTQWLRDHPKPSLEVVRDIVSQIAKGLRAFHRMEMLHQDLRPDNIMIDTLGTIKIIDFGSVKVAGVEEMASPIEHSNLLGTAAYSAPEYFLGEHGSARSDIFSLGVITYYLLSNQLPYGAHIARTKTQREQRKLKYRALLEWDKKLPAWVDEAIQKAVHLDPMKRYEDVTEFVHDLHIPNATFLNKTRPPLMARDPVTFWKGVSFLLLLALLFVGWHKTGASP